MSTDPPNQVHNSGEPVHSDVAFEKRDITVSVIYKYLFFLGLTTVAALVISLFVLRHTTKLAASEDAPPPPSREALGAASRTLPPEPRLQGVPGHGRDPQQDLRDKLRTDSQANESLGWIDEKSGIAQIPVKDAMKIVAEKGLPEISAPPAQ
jgi:hypothetical protein